MVLALSDNAGAHMLQEMSQVEWRGISDSLLNDKNCYGTCGRGGGIVGHNQADCWTSVSSSFALFKTVLLVGGARSTTIFSCFIDL